MSKEIVIKNKLELRAYVAKEGARLTGKAVISEIGDDWEEVQKQTVRQILSFDEPDPPDYGEDWGPWLKEHFEECLSEAHSIVA
jgi:hypothetical protein